MPNGLAPESDELYQKHGCYYEVIDKLQTDSMVDGPVQRIALQIANSRRVDDLWRLAGEAKSAFVSSDRDIEICRQALNEAQMASDLAPDHPMILFIWGSAHEYE